MSKAAEDTRAYIAEQFDDNQKKGIQHVLMIWYFILYMVRVRRSQKKR